MFSVSKDRTDVLGGVFLASELCSLFLAGEPPDDPRIGFLPPNNGTTGQGFVTFTVGLKKNLPSLTRIDAQANIYFDKNEPIETPPIFNTVRKTPSIYQRNSGELLAATVNVCIKNDFYA